MWSGNHSLEDFSIILEKIMIKINFNHLLRVHKIDIINTKNLQIITRQCTKIRYDKGKINNTMLQNHAYPNLRMKRQIFNDSTKFSKYLTTQEYRLDHPSNKVN